MKTSKNNKKFHILIIDCEDQKGLIHKVTGVLLAHEYNITNNREFVDNRLKHFYMRTEFEGVMEDRARVLKEIKDVLPGDANVSMPERSKKKIVVLATIEQHCLGELLLRNAYGEINADIQAVISNHGKLRELTTKFSIPFHHIANKGRQRALHESEILAVLEKYRPDYLVLAKYMRVLSPDFVEKYRKRIINIHHSFLPAFAGANPYRQAYIRGVKIIGATAHFVTNELDEGPIIVQDVAPVDHTFDANVMKQAGRDIEKIALTRALRLVCDDKVFLNGNKTIVFE